MHLSVEVYCDKELVTCYVKNSIQISITRARSTLEDFCSPNGQKKKEHIQLCSAQCFYLYCLFFWLNTLLGHPV